MGKKSNQARFPLARIKKMIQQDEDVGKVAQATPIVVSKALELFLGSLVAACVKDAEGRGSHKISPYGLKRAVTATPMLDFCADIVEAIPDPLEGEEDDDVGPPKKKRAAAGKKRAAASDAQEGASDGSGGAKRAKPAPRKQRTAASKKAKKGGDDDDDSDDFIDDDEPDSDAGAARSSSRAPKYDDDDDYEEA